MGSEDIPKDGSQQHLFDDSSHLQLHLLPPFLVWNEASDPVFSSKINCKLFMNFRKPEKP
jgi:hypothetical protein